MKTLPKLTVLIEIQPFLLNKWTSDYYKPSVDFQSYEKVDFDTSANIINAYVDGGFSEVHALSVPLM